MSNSNHVPNTVLVVEDEPAIAVVCSRVLKGEGWKVEVAVNGLEAQDLIDKQPYTLLIVDMRTPEMNGEQFYQYISEHHPQLVKHIIFTTGNLLDDNMRSFLESSGRLFLSKPFTTDELRGVVRQAMEMLKK